MSTPTSIASQRLYVVTDAGREAIDSSDVCRCEWQRQANTLVCDQCGTVQELRRGEHALAVAGK